MNKYFLLFSILLWGTISIVNCQRSARQNQWGRRPRPDVNLFFPNGPPGGSGGGFGQPGQAFGNGGGFRQPSGNGGGFGQPGNGGGFGQPSGNGGGFGQPSGNGGGFGQPSGNGGGFGQPSGNGGGFGQPFGNGGGFGQPSGNGGGFGQPSGNGGGFGQPFGNGEGFGQPQPSDSFGSSSENNQWGREPGRNDRDRRQTTVRDWNWGATSTTFRPTLKAPVAVEHSPPAGCNCQVGPQFNPVCGSDGKTYRNRELLNCISNCSGGLTMRRLGAC